MYNIEIDVSNDFLSVFFVRFKGVNVVLSF